MKKQIVLLGAILISFSSFAQDWSSNTTTIYNNPLTKSVGIGINSPLDKLHVIGAARLNKDGSSSTFSSHLYLGNGLNTKAFNFQLNNSGSELNLWTYHFGTWNRKYVFTESGELGIGLLTTSTPLDKLHVMGGARFNKNGSSGFSSHLYLGNENNDQAYNFQLNSDGSALNLWAFNTGPGWSNKFIFTNGGLFGIGAFAASPQAYLHVKGADHGPGLIVEPGNTTAAYGATIRAKNNFSKSFVVENSVGTPSEPFIVYGDGKTKIGTQFTQIDAAAKLAVDGKTHIGSALTTSSAHYNDYLLSVNGKLVCKEVYVTNQNWADFVFAADYKLPALKDVEAFYKLNKHLPEITSAKEVEENGVSVGEMNKLLLQKIEELTIYLVEQQKEIDLLKKKLK